MSLCFIILELAECKNDQSIAYRTFVSSGSVKADDFAAWFSGNDIGFEPFSILHIRDQDFFKWNE